MPVTKVYWTFAVAACASSACNPFSKLLAPYLEIGYGSHMSFCAVSSPWLCHFIWVDFVLFCRTQDKLSLSLSLQSEEKRMPGTTSAKEAWHGHKMKNSEEDGNVWGLLRKVCLLVNYPAFLIFERLVSTNIYAMCAHTAILRWVSESITQTRAASLSTKSCISSMCCCYGTWPCFSDGVTGAPDGHSAATRTETFLRGVTNILQSLPWSWCGGFRMAAWNRFWYYLVYLLTPTGRRSLLHWIYQHKGCQEKAALSGPFH